MNAFRRVLLLTGMALAMGASIPAAAGADDSFDMLTASSVRFDGAAAGDRAGFVTSSAGDVNGDGRDDVIVSSPFTEIGGLTDVGTTYVVYSKEINPDLDLASFGPGDGFRIDGAGAGNIWSGFTAAAAGDVNGDGYDDVITGTYRQGGTGCPGAAGGTSWVIYGGPSGTDLSLGSIAPADGFRITGAAPGCQSGYSVAGAGDVNGDGLGDVIIGAISGSYNGRTNSGSAWVIYGKTLSTNLDLTTLAATDGFRIDGATQYGELGITVAGAGDVNGDGRADLIAGAQLDSSSGRSFSGSAYVIYGKPANTNLDLASFTSTDGFRIDGALEGDQLGRPVAAAGDVNGDGLDDVMAGTYVAGNNGRPNSGSAWVIYGKAANVNVDLASLAPEDGFRIDGAAPGNQLGYATSIGGTGDVNGDGRDDVITGSLAASKNGRIGSGSTYVLYGKSAGTNVDLASLPPVDGLRIDGAAAGDHLGYSASGAGDRNGDGLADVIIGADMASNNGRAQSGSAYIFSPYLRLTVARSGTGQGSVAGGGANIDCGTGCSAIFRNGTEVTLTATPAPGSSFTGWTGSCTGSDPTCTLTVDEAGTATAQFTKDSVPVPPNPPNDGTAIYDPPTGKLKIRLKCGPQYRPRCLRMVAWGVTGKRKKARAMSARTTARNRKAGKWGYATLKVKPAFRTRVQNMGTRPVKTLWVRIRVTHRKRGLKRVRTVHHRYRVRVRE